MDFENFYPFSGALFLWSCFVLLLATPADLTLAVSSGNKLREDGGRCLDKDIITCCQHNQTDPGDEFLEKKMKKKRLQNL